MGRGRGKLKFKGESEKAKKKKSNSKHEVNIPMLSTSIDLNKQQHSIDARLSVAGSGCNQINDDINESADVSLSPQICHGQGLITTSSTVVTGHNTSFKTQLHVGDAILAHTTKGEEMRVVKMVLSQVSISISSAFSSDLKTPTQFKYINKPRDVAREKAFEAAKARLEQEEVEQRAMGTYGKKGEIVYRERTEHGSYRIKREQATTDMSRSDLLAVRAKKKSDRYC